MRLFVYTLAIFLCTCTTFQTAPNPVYKCPVDWEPLEMKEPIQIATVPEVYQDILHTYCTENQVPYIIMARLIQKESNWNPNAIGYNSNGSMDLGISQFNSNFILDHASRFGYISFNPFDPVQALGLATKLVASLYKQFGDWYLAVAAYNCGGGRVRRNEIPETTKRYAAYITGGV